MYRIATTNRSYHEILSAQLLSEILLGRPMYVQAHSTTRETIPNILINTSAKIDTFLWSHDLELSPYFTLFYLSAPYTPELCGLRTAVFITIVM